MLNSTTNLLRNPIIYRGIDSINKLKTMGLTYDIFALSVTNGHKMKLKKSKYATPICKSISFWDNTIVMLRKQLVEKHNWSTCDDYNLNRTISPQNDFAIVVSSGNSFVGKNNNPSTLNKKGQLSAAVVEVNNILQLTLFPIYNEPRAKKYNIERIPHWFLLYYNDGKNIWMELSRPREIGSDGRISSWYERIILEPVELQSDNSIKNKIAERTTSKEYDIDISKKQ